MPTNAVPVRRPLFTVLYLHFPVGLKVSHISLRAQTNVGGRGRFLAHKQVDLDNAPYNFGRFHIYHSAEFRSDNPQRWQFWNQVLIQMKLKQ
jgi:hypothetical protein